MSGPLKLNQLISSSRLAFLTQQNETALSLARQAIALDPKQPEGYKCAADAYMSLARYDEAIKNYENAAKHDPLNGDRYFDLGYAQATTGMKMSAIQSLAKAEELGCSTSNLPVIHFLSGIICFELGRYEDALANLDKAEALSGTSLDILQRKAVIYGILNDVPKGIQAANQIKMLSPTEYRGYQIAYKLLIQAERFDDAAKELEKAGKYASSEPSYYADRVDFELQRFKKDGVKEHLDIALAVIEEGLKATKPGITEVIQGYTKAAELYVQQKEPDKAIACLKAAEDPIRSYNNGFAIAAMTEGLATLIEYDIEELMAADGQEGLQGAQAQGAQAQGAETAKAQDAQAQGAQAQGAQAQGAQAQGAKIAKEGTERGTDGSKDYLTEYIPEAHSQPQEDDEPYRLDETADIPHSTGDVDNLHKAYMDAYLLKKDFKKIIDHARLLQESDNPYSNYLGRFNEAIALSALGSPDAERKCDEAISFFRNAMLKDATDLLATTFRIQLCIETGGYDEAEEVCGLLAKEVRDPLLKYIEKLKSEGA
ncbi:MAG: hypothetical protein LBG81_01540 [Coriobacteriaceae bacterium]|jgi:tetratricopeptide (TPR) repeat protein|nr:hypothetical protein [Coriobacteriaceae bacterium]